MNDGTAVNESAPCRVLDEAYPLRLWFSVAAALLGSLQFGYGYGVLNTALKEIMASIKFADESVLNSAVVLGSAVGAITAGVVADHAGPRRAQIYNVAAFLLGALLTSINMAGYYGFLAGRIITGFGAGACSLYAPRYIAEIAPLELRGRLVSQCQVFVNVGILAGYCIGIPYEYDMDTVAVGGTAVPWWRVMTIAGVIPAVLQLWGSRAILFEAVPGDTEHAVNGRGGGVAATLLQASEYRQDSVARPAGMAQAAQTKPAATATQEGWRALLRREYRWMLALALGLPVLQQACGVNTVILYSSEVFGDAGLQAPIWGSILMGAVNLVFTLLAALLMDGWGRRPLLLTSYAGMATCLFLVSLLNYLHMSPEVGFATAVFLILYVLCFALGAGPVTALYLSEILPKRIKGKAAALATFLAWMSNLAVALTFCPLMRDLSLGGTYLIYGLLNILALVYLWVLMPETKRRTWHEIEAMLLLPPRPKLRNMLRAASPSTSSGQLTAPLLVGPPPWARGSNGSSNGHSGGRKGEDAYVMSGVGGVYTSSEGPLSYGRPPFLLPASLTE